MSDPQPTSPRRRPSTSSRTRWPGRSSRSRLPRARRPRRPARRRRRGATAPTRVSASKAATVACMRTSLGAGCRAPSRPRDVRGPTPSASASARSAGVVDVPPQRWVRRPRRPRRHRRRGARCASRGPNRGRNASRPGAATIVVPMPVGVGDERHAARRAPPPAPRSSSSGRSAGRSAQTAASRSPGSRRRSSAAACTRVPLRSPVVPSGITSAPSVAPARGQRVVVGDHQHRAPPAAQQRGRDGVGGEGRRQVAARARRRAARSRDLPTAGGLTGTRTPYAGRAGGGATSPTILPGRRCSDLAMRHCGALRDRRYGGDAGPRAARTRRSVAKPRKLGSAGAGRSRSASRSSSRCCWRSPSATGSTARSIPADGRLRRRGQPHLAPRPADLRALRLRPRPAAAVPRQGRAVRRPGRSARILRSAGQIPVYRLTTDAVAGVHAPRSRRCRRASASSSTPRARSPATPTCGRWPARPAPPGSR